MVGQGRVRTKGGGVTLDKRDVPEQSSLEGPRPWSHTWVWEGLMGIVFQRRTFAGPHCTLCQAIA